MQKVLIPYQQTVMVSAFCFVYLMNILPLCCHILCQFLFVVWITNTALLYFGYWYCLSPVSPFQTNKDKTMNCHY